MCSKMIFLGSHEPLFNAAEDLIWSIQQPEKENKQAKILFWKLLKLNIQMENWTNVYIVIILHEQVLMVYECKYYAQMMLYASW